MAKKKIDLFVEVHGEKEFDNIIKNNADLLICAELYSNAFGSCTALDRLFSTIKIAWSDGKLILLKVPTDEIEVLQRFRDQSEPVYMFISNMKVTKVFRGVDTVRFAEVAKRELDYYKQEVEGTNTERMFYELDEPTPDEVVNEAVGLRIEDFNFTTSQPLLRQHGVGIDLDHTMVSLHGKTKEWMTIRALEKEEETTSLIARRSSRQAVRKRHRAVLMVPYLTDVNFVLFWPHCFHAHPELYERWDANNIVMVGREEIELTPEKITDIFYAGDAPLNEASINKLQSGPALAICFRLLDADANFVALVRKILYEEVQPYDETDASRGSVEMKTAFDRYKTFSPTREEVWQQRREEREQQKETIRRKRARYLSEMHRLNRQAIEEALEAKRQEKEQRKLLLLKTGNLGALDELNAEEDDENVDIVVPEELPVEEEEESSFEEDEDEYFPPPGLLIPGFYAPPNDIARANGLAVLFPKLVLERVTPQPEFLPRHVLVLLEISKRYKAIDAIAPFKHAIIHMGIFQASSPYNSVHIAYTVKQFDTLDNNTQNLEQLKIAFMLSVEVDIPLLHLMDLNPIHVSRDCSMGEEECAAMFPVDYGDDIDQLEDFVEGRVEKVPAV